MAQTRTELLAALKVASKSIECLFQKILNSLVQSMECLKVNWPIFAFLKLFRASVK